MSLDFAECDRARLARDAVYDGRFYTGVHTTGIYCRPVCPVRPARSANVSFFPSAAAAEAAGFRPCLRCRPETAPFSSAWIGSRATVERALRLIVEDGALDAEGATVERVAERLGVGARQLTRLFARYLQASPSEVAKTARVQRAKRLIDETSLPMKKLRRSAGGNSILGLTEQRLAHMLCFRAEAGPHPKPGEGIELDHKLAPAGGPERRRSGPRGTVILNDISMRWLRIVQGPVRR